MSHGRQRDPPADDETQRLDQGTRILGLALLAHLLLSLRLWAGDRLFPRIPLFESLRLAGSAEYLAAGALLLLSAGLVVAPRQRKLAWGLVVLLPAYCLFDQLRMQPWLYLFWLLLVPLCWPRNHPAVLLGVQRLTIAGLYVWSGLQKLNPEYWDYVHGYVLHPLEDVLSAAVFNLLVQGSYLAGPLEAILGLGLLFVRTRTVACCALWGMHLLLLACLWKLIVWPWNLVMMLFVWRYFFQSDWQPDLKPLWQSRARRLLLAVVALVWLAPLLNLADRWDHYLSFSLYSGRSQAMVIYVRQDAVDRLPARLQPLLSEFVDADGYRLLPADDWSQDELHVPVTPQRRIFLALAREVCGWDLGPGEHQVLFAISRRSGRGEKEVFACEHLR